MIVLSPVVEGISITMLTPEPIEEARRSCIDRFGARFEGFAPIPVETVAKAKWAEYRAKQITRAEMEAWLAEQKEEQEIRKRFNQMRG